ncbi:MAG: bifunctional alpha/beta hydrolase/OsmC family protein [Pseudomonadota bacterium]
MSTITTQRISFPGHGGDVLAARLDVPSGPVRAYALFAHCFTCSKDILAARRISAHLARSGIAVLRFDFTGLGSSNGEFSSTNFSSNVQDLVLASDYLREHFEAPALLIGHSLGGAAVLMAAGQIAEVKAVATIGAPSDVSHVLHNFDADLTTIEEQGTAQVSLQGRAFTIKKQFIDDAREANLRDAIKTMRKPLMVLHAPTDATVGVENATGIFGAAKHPKSFVSLDGADHLLSRAADAEFAASIITGWVQRYLPADTGHTSETEEAVRVAETGEGKFQNTVLAGKHRLFADEPESVGGLDTGPSPYDFLATALAACTSMTLRMYADHKKMELGRISVRVSHNKVHTSDCAHCTQDQVTKGGRIDRFVRRIDIEGGVPDGLDDKLLEIADKCPVHRTLEASSMVATVLNENTPG